MMRKVTVSPPLMRKPGDEFALVPGKIQQWRGGNLIAERTIDVLGSPVVTNDFFGTSIGHFYLEQVMGVSATITNVTINQVTGQINTVFSDGQGRQYSNWADFVAQRGGLDADNELCRSLLELRLLGVTPDGSNLDALNGSTVTIDRQAATPVQFSLTVPG